MKNITRTLVELGDMTSANLRYSYGSRGAVAYGEETITELNLLELHRRHSDLVHLKMFNRQQESLNGADWDWWLVGRKRAIGMRIQAKRAWKNGVFSFKHEVKSSGKQQIDLLLASSARDAMLPMYLIYRVDGAVERVPPHSRTPSIRPAEYGCMFARACDVKKFRPNKLNGEFLKKCYPWHLLLEDLSVRPDVVMVSDSLDRYDASFLSLLGVWSVIADEGSSDDGGAREPRDLPTWEFLDGGEFDDKAKPWIVGVDEARMRIRRAIGTASEVGLRGIIVFGDYK